MVIQKLGRSIDTQMWIMGMHNRTDWIMDTRKSTMIFHIFFPIMDLHNATKDLHNSIINLHQLIMELYIQTGNHYKWDWPKSQFCMPNDSTTVVWLRNIKVGNVICSF